MGGSVTGVQRKEIDDLPRFKIDHENFETGKRSSPGEIGSIGIFPVWGDGTPTRDFVYVKDVAFGILKAAENCRKPCLLNISTGTETSINQLVNLLIKISKFEGEIVWDKTKVNGQSRRVFDISLAKKNIRYTPQTSIEKGFKKTFDWYSEKYFN